MLEKQQFEVQLVTHKSHPIALAVAVVWSNRTSFVVETGILVKKVGESAVLQDVLLRAR